MIQTLIKQRKFYGRYVAVKDFSDPRPIANGKNPDQIYRAALKKGCSHPMIVFVPREGMVQIYAASIY